MSKEDTRFRELEKKVGIFASVALIGILAAGIFIAWQKDYFSRKYEVRFTVQKGTGFTRGMPVKLSGFRIGRVKSLALNEHATVDVQLQLDKEYQKWIKEDSEARLVKEGLIGDYIIEISGGTPTAKSIVDKGAIKYVKTKGLDELADDVAEKVRPVLLEVRDVISYVNDPDGDIKQALKNINLLAQNLEATRQKADILLAAANRETGHISGKVAGVLDEADKTVKKIGPVIEKADSSVALLNDKIPILLERIDSSLINLEKISLSARTTAETTLPRVPRMVKQTEGVLDDTGTVLNAVKGMWPIRGYISPAAEMQFIRGDSRE